MFYFNNLYNFSICTLIFYKQALNKLITEVETGGKLGSNKCVNLPGIHVHLPPVSETDRIDIEFGVAQNVDMIFASFIRDAESVKDVRKTLGSKGSHILVISKIENDLGVRK